jgi:hypothetical protein
MVKAMFDRASKDDSLLAVLDMTVRTLAPREIVVRDWWEADRFAVSISSNEHPERLVYISTFRKLSGCCYFDCEPTPAGYPSRSGDDVDLPTLLDAVRTHLF